MSGKRYRLRRKSAKNNTERRLYFAYGSNLNISQMLIRCPTAREVSRYTLRDYKLVFRSVADIIPFDGGAVEGALYNVGPIDIKALDVYEGVKSRLYDQVEIELEYGRRVFFYRMHADYIEPPLDDYLRTIVEGFFDWGIPYETLDAAVAHAWANETRFEYQNVAKKNDAVYDFRKFWGE